MPIERPTETHPPGGDGFASPAIEASEVGVTLDKAEILRGVTFGLDRGCLIGLIGPNGSGKTTLLRALSGVIPFRGDIRIAGRPIQDWKPRERARRIAFVRQSLPLSFDFSVSELVPSRPFAPQGLVGRIYERRSCTARPGSGVRGPLGL